MKMYLPPKGAPQTRRRFLKKGLFGGVLLALGGAGWLASRRGAQVAVPGGLRVLSAGEYAVMWSIVQRLVPAREGFPSPDALGTTAACDGIMALMEEVTQGELKQLLMLFENALPNFLFSGRTEPFTQMTPPEQEEVLAQWRDSRLKLRRTGFLALRGIVMAAYYGNRETWKAGGYPGPPPGIYDSQAPVWKGRGEPRPLGNGTFIDTEASP